MRTVRTKLFQFNELSKEAQEKAISQLSDINVNYDWWDFTYNDAKEVGITLDGFDIDSNSIIIKIDDADYTAHEIIKNHGEECATHLTAKEYNLMKETILYNAPKDKFGTFEDEHELDAKLDDLQEQFTKQIGFDYLGILKHEYEYQTSDEAIKETIIVNDYEFTQDGRQF